MITNYLSEDEYDVYDYTSENLSIYQKKYELEEEVDRLIELQDQLVDRIEAVENEKEKKFYFEKINSIDKQIHELGDTIHIMNKILQRESDSKKEIVETNSTESERVTSKKSSFKKFKEIYSQIDSIDFFNDEKEIPVKEILMLYYTTPKTFVCLEEGIFYISKIEINKIYNVTTFSKMDFNDATLNKKDQANIDHAAKIIYKMLGNVDDTVIFEKYSDKHTFNVYKYSCEIKEDSQEYFSPNKSIDNKPSHDRKTYNKCLIDFTFTSVKNPEYVLNKSMIINRNDNNIVFPILPLLFNVNTINDEERKYLFFGFLDSTNKIFESFLNLFDGEEKLFLSVILGTGVENLIQAFSQIVDGYSISFDDQKEVTSLHFKKKNKSIETVFQLPWEMESYAFENFLWEKGFDTKKLIEKNKALPLHT